MKNKSRPLFLLAVLGSLLILTACPFGSDVTFTFDSGTCKSVAIEPAPTATISKGNPPNVKAQFTVKICVVCKDTDPGASVGSGASIKLDGFTEFSVPSNVKQLLGSPLTYNATTKCYEKTFAIPDTDVLDPQGVLGGKTLKVTINDKNGQKISDTSVTIQPIP